MDEPIPELIQLGIFQIEERGFQGHHEAPIGERQHECPGLFPIRGKYLGARGNLFLEDGCDGRWHVIWSICQVEQGIGPHPSRVDHRGSQNDRKENTPLARPRSESHRGGRKWNKVFEETRRSDGQGTEPQGGEREGQAYRIVPPVPPCIEDRCHHHEYGKKQTLYPCARWQGQEFPAHIEALPRVQQVMKEHVHHLDPAEAEKVRDIWVKQQPKRQAGCCDDSRLPSQSSAGKKMCSFGGEKEQARDLPEGDVGPRVDGRDGRKDDELPSSCGPQENESQSNREEMGPDEHESEDEKDRD